MPTPKGRNRKARRAAAASPKSAADPAPEAEAGSSKATVEGKGAASHEKQRRQQQRQQQLEPSNKEKAASVVAPDALPGGQGSTSKGKGGGRKKDTTAARGTHGRNGKKKEPATTGGEDGGNVADLDADDFLSGGFMSMACDPDDEDKADDAERELEGGGGDNDSSSGDNDGVDGSSSDDEDDEGGDGGILGEDESDSDDEDANASAMDLKGLAETDPEFYSFLQKEEPTLLEFDPMDSDDSEDEDGDGGEGGGAAAKGADGEAGAETTTTKSTAALLREASKGGGVPLTMPLLKAMRQEAFDRTSIQGVRRMIKAFRCGCHLGDEAAEGKAGSGGGGSGVQQKFRIPSSEVYNELMVCSLEGLHSAFMHLLFPGRESKTAAEPPVTASGSSSEGAKKKRRRDEDEGDGEGAAVAATGSSSSGPNKKKKQKRKGGTPIAATDDDKDGDSGGGGLQGGSARQSVMGAGAERGGAPQEDGGGGALARGRSRVAAAVILTKEDFRAAALLPAWKPIQPALYSFFKSLLHVLDELHDRALLSFLLSRLEHYVPLLVPFPGLARGFLKTLLGLWGGAGAEAKSSGGGTEQEGEEAERVRLLAYLRVRQMAAALPFPFVEGCMKRLYLAFAKRARAPPASQSGKVSLRVMEGCVVELYGMDVGSAYQNAFLYIRQLSLLLRRAMQHRTKDSVQAVRRWQVVTCLRVWTGVLAAAPGEDELRMLIFPLAQVIEGIVRLSATLRHSPLVFQLVRMRQRLAAAAELYVPCATPLLEVIRSPALFKKATASTGAPPNVPAILRLGKTQVDEGRAQGAVVEEALRLLGQEMDLYRYSAAFPELVLPVLGHLKKFAKLTKVSKWRMMTRGLVETLETRATWAAGKRLELGICPSEVEGLEVLRPEGAPSMRKRLGASESEVERVVDDENTPLSSKPTAAVTTKGKSSENKKTKKQKGNAVQGHDDDTEDDDSDDGSSTPKRKRSSGGGGKAKPPSAAGAAGDISAPDLVEDLGAWSDTEWD